MKLIIDIPKEVVVAIENGLDYRYDIHTAIAQGITYEEPTQGDLISREALRKSIEDGIDDMPLNNYDEGWNTALNAAIDEIDNAPTVDLWEMRQEATENALKKAEVLYKRPQGEWIKDGVGLFKCSICSRHICTDISNDKPYINFPFCHCGADMRKGGQDAAD